MKYDSTKRVPSKISPDVVYIIRRMNVYRRDRLDEAKAPFAAKIQALREQLEALEPQISPLRAELEPLTKEYRESFERAKEVAQAKVDELIAGGATKEKADAQVTIGPFIDFPDEPFKRWTELTQQIKALEDPIREQMEKIDRNELTPAAVEFVTVGIEGLEIDNEAATVKSLRENGQDDIYAELAKAVARELGLLPEEISNLEQEPTLVGVGDGPKTNGNAAPAASGETIIRAVA